MTCPSGIDRRSTVVIHCGITNPMIIPYQGVLPQCRELGRPFLKCKIIVVDWRGQRMRLKEIDNRDYIGIKWDLITYWTSQANAIVTGWIQICDAMWRCEGTRGGIAHIAHWRCEIRRTLRSGDAMRRDAMRCDRISHIAYDMGSHGMVNYM